MNRRLVERILRDIKLTPERQEIYERLLSLEDDVERISTVELKYGQSLGLGGTFDNYNGQLFWTSTMPFNMNVEVKMKKDFQSLEELQEYLTIRNLPGKRAFQYSRESYGLEFEEYNFDVHFGLER